MNATQPSENDPQAVCKPIARPVQDRQIKSPRSCGAARTSDIVLSPEAPGYEEWLRRNQRR